MRLVMLAPRPDVQGPLPKLTPLLVDGLRDLGCEVQLLPWGRRHEGEGLVGKLLSRPKDILNARREIVRGDFHAVVVNTAHDWNTLTRDLALTLLLPRDRRVILQFHGSQSPRLVAPGSLAFKVATRLLLKQADGILVLSSGERDEWVAFRPQTTVLVVRNVRPEAAVLWNGSGRPRAGDVAPEILCVSRLLAGKGVLELVRALPEVRRTVPSRLVFVGTGEEYENVRALARELGVEEQVELAGYLQGPDLAARYAGATVFALPTTLPEGFPTVLLEAMAAGLPIVTTDARGPADHLVEGENALFVPNGNVSALADALVKLLEDASLRSRMSAANRIKVHDFDQEPVAHAYLAALRAILLPPAERA